MAVYKQKEQGKQKTARILGIVFIIVVAVLCYLIAMALGTADYFYYGVGTEARSSYMIAQMIASVIAPVIIYAVKFGSVAAIKPGGEYSFERTNQRNGKFVYDGWMAMSIIAGVAAAVTAAVVFLIMAVVLHDGSYIGDYLTHLLLWVWIVQAGLTFGVFHLPCCKPLEQER